VRFALEAAAPAPHVLEAQECGMTREAFGSKPTVLRCSRCGRFVDWEHARLQIVCDCRNQLELPPVMVRQASETDRERIQELFLSDFGHLQIVAFGEVMHAHLEPALVAEMKDDVAGALAYRRLDDALHVVALATDPMWQRSGVGGYLLAEAELMARRDAFARIVTTTTNDNLPSIYFFQRHGFRLTEVVPNAFGQHRSSPAASGFASIPILDELRMEKRLV
jgi:N-acetylglutamate synthase-like GNAT family acetyltransferase